MVRRDKIGARGWVKKLRCAIERGEGEQRKGNKRPRKAHQKRTFHMNVLVWTTQLGIVGPRVHSWRHLTSQLLVSIIQGIVQSMSNYGRSLPKYLRIKSIQCTYI